MHHSFYSQELLDITKFKQRENLGHKFYFLFKNKFSDQFLDKEGTYFEDGTNEQIRWAWNKRNILSPKFASQMTLAKVLCLTKPVSSSEK